MINGIKNLIIDIVALNDMEGADDIFDILRYKYEDVLNAETILEQKAIAQEALGLSKALNEALDDFYSFVFECEQNNIAFYEKR